MNKYARGLVVVPFGAIKMMWTKLYHINSFSGPDVYKRQYHYLFVPDYVYSSAAYCRSVSVELCGDGNSGGTRLHLACDPLRML